MNSDDESDETEKRNLPSWISSTSRDVGNKSRGKEPGESNVGEETQLAKGHDRAHGILPSKGTSKGKRSASSSSDTSSFSKILEGVVFVLSGFVNPERSTLRSQALEMGAEYQADWNSNCTLLVCAFRNTPKFRQVEADCGTIVSQEWISECYMQKKLVDIDSYLMHAGKPWRRGKISHEASHDSETPRTKKPHKQVINRSQSKSTAAVSTKDMQNGDPETSKGQFAPSTVKEWAFDDLDKTISWLNSQDEKPEPSEIKNIAAEGILTCLQDAIDSLEQMQDIGQVTEQWRFVPRVVEELAKLEKDRSLSLPKKDLHKQAVICKEIYEAELKSLKDSEIKKRKPKEGRKERGKEKDKDSSCNDAGYDSDETIEMSEEEIETAYRNLLSVNSSVE